MDNTHILLHHLLQKYEAVQGGLSCPPLRISERIDNTPILIHHLLQEYFSQSKMLTSNVQLGYVLTRWGGGASCPGQFILPLAQNFRQNGGQAVQGGLSCPLPRISERMDNTQILLHHLLQEHLVERDINFILVNLRCLLQIFSWVTY